MTNFYSKDQIIRISKGWVVPILILLVWEYMAHQDPSHAYAFASIEDMIKATKETWATGELPQSLNASISRAVIGLLIGGGIGFILGTLMSVSRLVDSIFGPIYHLLRQVPLLGLTPLLSLWLGNGDPAKLFVVCLSAFYPLVLATYESLNQVEAKYREVGSVFKLSRSATFFRILLPAALPNIFTGLSFALAFAWLATIGSEILFNAGAGLGNMMMNAQSLSRMDTLIVVTILIGLLGFSMNFVINRLGDYLFRWRNTHKA
jgi:sulfonate transport system permease protein